MNIVKKVSISLSILIIAALATSANAISFEELTVSGFGSIVGGITDEDEVTQLTNLQNRLNFTQQSNIGLQFNADLGDGLQAITQLQAQGSEASNARVSWAYLNYEFNEDLILRAGRIRLPLYAYSDYLDVGYAQTFLRGPVSLYFGSFNEINGISAYKTVELGDFSLVTSILFGDIEEDVDIAGATAKSDTEDIHAIRFDLSQDWFRVSLLGLKGQLAFPIPALEPVFASLIAAGASPGSINNIRLNGDSATFMSLNMGIDYENIIFEAEYTKSQVPNSFILDTKAWYAMIGYRFERITPYLIYETSENDRNTDLAKEFPSFLQAGVQAIVDGGRVELKGISAGFRYEIHKSAALKVEYNHYYDIIDTLNAYGTDADKQELNVLSAAIDFVF